MLSQRVKDAIESGRKKILSVCENRLANAIDGIKESVVQTLAENLKSNNTATSDNESSDTRANAIVENTIIMTSSCLNINDRPILS